MTPDVEWTNAVDPQGDALTYEVEVFADAGMATLLASAAGVSEHPTSTSWTVDTALAENADTYWRVRADDGSVAGAWSTLEHFFVNAVEEAPGAPTAASPLDGDSVDSLRPTLTWTEATDPDRDPLIYGVRVFSGDTLIVDADGVAGLSWTVDVDLVEDRSYTWDVRAADDTGLTSDYAAAQGFTVDSNNSAPTDIEWVRPLHGDAPETTSPVLEVTTSVDVEGTALTYVFELDTVATFDSGNLIAGAEAAPTWDLSADGVELTENVEWQVRARAEDEGGAATAWATITIFVRGANDAPRAPTLLAPDADTVFAEEPSAPVLVFGNSVDPEGDDVLYDVVVASDEALTDVVAEASALEPGSGTEGNADQTSWTSTELAAGTYFWTARAVDAGAEGAWASPRSFTVEGTGCACESSVAAGGSSGFALLLLLAVLRRRER